MEILDAFAGAEVDAEARAIHPAVVRTEQAGVFQRLPGRGGGELAVDAGVLPAAGVRHEAAEVEVLDLGGELRREAAGVEPADRPDAAAALHLGVEHRVHAVSQRRDRAHAGDDNSSSHIWCSVFSVQCSVFSGDVAEH